MQIIAEVKTHSPFGWKSDHSWDELLEIADEVGDMVSVHTDQRWGGSFDLLSRAKNRTNKPILAKGIHHRDSQIRRAVNEGADFVLVVGRLPGIYVEQCLIESNSLNKLQELPHDVKAVWNSRNLRTGELKSETFDQALRVFPGWLCQASNIVTVEDIHPRADAVLIGTHLPEIAPHLQAYKFSTS